MEEERSGVDERQRRNKGKERGGKEMGREREDREGSEENNTITQM